MRDNRDQGVVSSMIIFAIVILFVFALTGCSTAVPVTAKFPEAPGKLAMYPCPDLQKLGDDAKLSDVAKTVTINYSTYYECAIKVDTWREWYEIQRRIFENVK